MRFLVWAIGKPKLDYAAEGVREYVRRLKHYARVEVEFLRARDESAELLARSEGTYRIALDERGRSLRSLDVAERITRLENRGEIKAVSFLVGGANGHTDALRQQCDEIWTLSPLTLQHELALVVLLEQLYRGFTIKRGEPYHRE